MILNTPNHFSTVAQRASTKHSNYWYKLNALIPRESKNIKFADINLKH